MSDKVFHLEPTGSGLTAIMHHAPDSLIGCGIILDHATRTVLLRNGDGSDALIPADLLPEDLTTATGDLDALRVVKHLVELIRKHEAEQKDLWWYIKRLKMQTEAERLTFFCTYTDGCPPDRNSASGPCPHTQHDISCCKVQHEHWLEILRKESDEEQSKTQNG